MVCVLRPKHISPGLNKYRPTDISILKHISPGHNKISPHRPKYDQVLVIQVTNTIHWLDSTTYNTILLWAHQFILVPLSQPTLQIIFFTLYKMNISKHVGGKDLHM